MWQFSDLPFVDTKLNDFEFVAHTEVWKTRAFNQLTEKRLNVNKNNH